MRITLLAYRSPSDSEVDVVIPQITQVLQQLGHEPQLLEFYDSVPNLIEGLRNQKPDLVFNLAENFGEDLIGGLIGVVGVLDLLQIPYTGSGPGELYLQEDKSLSKKLLAYENLDYPDFAAFWPDAGMETGGKLRMPLFVKPLRSDASYGIVAQESLVHNTAELFERVAAIHRQFNDGALAEEYIEGREFYVGIIGNQQPIAFPPIEMDFSGLPEGAIHVMDSAAKFAEGSPEYQGTHAKVADDLTGEQCANLQDAAIKAYQVLRVRDYGRVDLRVTPSGKIYIIEVNANCYLEQASEFAMGAAAMELNYSALIDRILKEACSRSPNVANAT